MGISWHSAEYSDLQDEILDYLLDELELDTLQAAKVLGRLTTMMIDYGAVDPT